MKTTISERGQVSSDAMCRNIELRKRRVAPDPVSALNFASEHGLETIPTDEWMKLLREGEEE